MAIALTLEEYLEDCDINYDLISHRMTSNSMATAEVAHVSGQQIAKSVVLADEGGYLMIVLPANRHIDLDGINHMLHRNMVMATEEEITDLFWDCEKGAIPPIGDAYGVEVLMDESLGPCHDVFFKAGSHTDLVHMSGKHFRKIMRNVDHGQFSSTI